MHRPGIDEIRLGGKVPLRLDVPILRSHDDVIRRFTHKLCDAAGYRITATRCEGSAGAEVILYVHNHKNLRSAVHAGQHSHP